MMSVGEKEIKDKLIEYGYIHMIQRLLSNDKIMPDTLYSLCFVFYHIKLNIILWQQQLNQGDTPNFGILDVKNKTSSIIKSNKPTREQKKIWTTVSCHIPSITTFLSKNITQRGKLDGIFTMDLGRDFKYFPSLLLYKSCNGEFIVEYEYKSSESPHNIKVSVDSIPQPGQLLYCHHENSIIYEINGSFYQLKLNYFRSENDLTNFVSLKQNQQLFNTTNQS